MPSCQRMKIGTGFTMHHHHRHFVLAVRSSIGLVRSLVASLVLSPYSFSVFLGLRSYAFTHMLHSIGYLNSSTSYNSWDILAPCSGQLCTPYIPPPSSEPYESSCVSTPVVPWGEKALGRMTKAVRARAVGACPVTSRWTATRTPTRRSLGGRSLGLSKDVVPETRAPAATKGTILASAAMGHIALRRQARARPRPRK